MTYESIDTIFKRTRYPAGEGHLQLRLDAPTETSVIEAAVRSFDDLCEVVVADRTLRRNDRMVEWFLPYFPFARHDRRNHIGDGFELGLALELAEPLRLLTADPHSDVSGQLLHIPQADSVEVFRSVGAFDDDPIIVVPDAGAIKKADTWSGDAERVQALKHRDPATGKLSGFEVLAEDLADRPCIIVDDLCDAGGTFLGLAKELRARRAGPLTLAITHGLFTKGTERLTKTFDRIYTFGYAPTQRDRRRNPSTDTRRKSATVQTIPFQTLYEKGARV